MTLETPFTFNCKAYRDLTGHFPHVSSRGNEYFLTVHDYDSDGIFAEVLKTRQRWAIKDFFLILINCPNMAEKPKPLSWTIKFQPILPLHSLTRILQNNLSLPKYKEVMHLSKQSGPGRTMLLQVYVQWILHSQYQNGTG